LEKIASAELKQFIHKDLPLSVRTLRDLYKESIDRVRVDSKETYHRLLEFAEVFCAGNRAGHRTLHWRMPGI